MKELISHLIYPHPFLLIALFGMVFIDLLSGIQKAKKNGVATSSIGMRRTINKATTYLTLNLSVLIILNITALADPQNYLNGGLKYSINILLLACSYIEMKSILENLIEINSEFCEIKKKSLPNDFAKLILIPIHNIIILKFKKL